MTTPLPAPDMPDDYDWNPGSVRSTIGDLGELAARLGALSTFDRRGEVIWQDDMRKGLSVWQDDTWDTGDSVQVVTTRAYNSPYSIRLTAGVLPDAYALIRRTFPLSEATRMGMEVCITLHGPGGLLVLDFSRRLAGFRWDAQVVINPDTRDVSIWTPGGYVLIETEPYQIWLGSGRVHIIKLVADYLTHKYVRLIFNDNEYNLTAYDMYESGAQVYEHNEVELVMFGDEIVPNSVGINYVIVTSNEP